MADYQDHIKQANKNLTILGGINNQFNQNWDWQVTAAYYTAVHLMNGHLAKTANLHYKTHADVKNALFASLSPCKVPDDIYTAFVKLENYSRRSRYLCHEDVEKTDDSLVYLTYDRHLKKSLGYLDKILSFFSSKYGESFEEISIKCLELKNLKLTHFKYSD